MRRLVLAAMFTLALGLVGSVPAVAAEVHVPFCGIDPMTLTGGIPGCTFTQNVHGMVQIFPSSVPCIDAPAPPGPFTGTLTITFNAVFHVTVNQAGDVWLTGTTEGAFSFVPFDPARPSYTGHFASWFGASLNRNNAVFHDIFNVHGTGSDGSTLTFHVIDHVNIDSSGVVTLTFTKVVC
jgi:hypothetical protein